MLETVLRRLSRFNPTERIAALNRKLSRLEADLQSLEQEIVSSGLAARGIDLSPFQEIRSGLDGVRAGLMTVAAQADSFPQLGKLLADANGKVDRMASRLEELRARVRGHRPPQA